MFAETRASLLIFWLLALGFTAKMSFDWGAEGEIPTGFAAPAPAMTIVALIYTLWLGKPFSGRSTNVDPDA